MITIKPIDSINPTLVKQFSYCPVIVWLKTWLLLEEPVTDSMRAGKENTTMPKGEGNVFVRTKEGSTLIDELRLEKDGSLTIIERKAYKSYNQSRYVEQAVASYVIAKAKISKIRRVKLEIQRIEKTIELSEDLVKDVEKIIEKTREVVKQEKPPPQPAERKKCLSCWYRKFCPHF